MDISMPRLNGMEATAIMKKQNPGMKIVILTVHETEEYVYEILRAGADGYVLKSAGKKEILAALKTAMSGEKFLSPGITNILIDGFSKSPHDNDHDPKKVIAQPGNTLTKRETEVLRYIANGNTNRQIAEILFLSVRTVNTHRTNLMQKLGMHDTAALVRFAIETGLITLKQ
jgi:DNA-binding NarL/FixJ family response regulator